MGFYFKFLSAIIRYHQFIMPNLFPKFRGKAG